jgi:hypothetical protein
MLFFVYTTHIVILPNSTNFYKIIINIPYVECKLAYGISRTMHIHYTLVNYFISLRGSCVHKM